MDGDSGPGAEELASAEDGQTQERGEGRSQELGKACLIHSGKLHFAPSLESNCEIRLLIEKLGKQEFQSRSEAAQPFAR